MFVPPHVDFIQSVDKNERQSKLLSNSYQGKRRDADAAYKDYTVSKTHDKYDICMRCV
ncbi:hypothetical protein KSB_42820 [Ktedonobacter robiniae]|uniref:Uncharacterized protein n=1 Tax=Ktedonobacter robiniae TaxID=2778365 RepID=A0ABQ3UT12_9CHLR|nr:hypothetical protein KSB_42820 [Ktedonobacter robiniae]